MKSKEEQAAKKAIQDAKAMIIYGSNFENAKAKIQEAINMFPNYVRNGQGMISVCEIRHLCNKTPKYSRKNTWLYTLLQIPTSSTNSEVQSRYQALIDDLCTLRQFPGKSAALKEIKSAMSIYNLNYSKLLGKRKASLEGDGIDTAASDENLFTAPFPEFKKIRKNIIFTSYQPHFDPLVGYCATVTQEMKLAFDRIFVQLIQTLQNFGGDQTLSNKEEETIRGELSDLEKMGYDVSALKGRFDLLVRLKELTKEDENYEEKKRALNSKFKLKKVQLEKVLDKVLDIITEINSENELIKAQHHNLKLEIASVKVELSKGHTCKTVEMEVKEETL